MSKRITKKRARELYEAEQKRRLSGVGTPSTKPQKYSKTLDKIREFTRKLKQRYIQTGRKDLADKIEEE